MAEDFGNMAGTGGFRDNLYNNNIYALIDVPTDITALWSPRFSGMSAEPGTYRHFQL